MQAQSDLNAAESALVSLQEAYDRALSLQGSSTNEMSDARNALDAAKAKQESLNARFNGLLATISNAESELKQAKEELMVFRHFRGSLHCAPPFLCLPMHI